MTNTKKILIVDDDDTLRETLKDQFSLHDEYAVTDVATATAGVKAVKAEHADMVILDVNLPDMDGREACKLMRRNGYKGPVIMLTGQSSDSDTILGLDSGANDYITKPFRFGVLLARIRAHLRQHEHSEDATFKVGPYTFKPASKILVRDDNKKVRLTEKETAIIKFSTAQAIRSLAAMFCCTMSGATTPGSPPTRLKPTFTACAKKLNATRARRKYLSPRVAATSSSLDLMAYPSLYGNGNGKSGGIGLVR